MKVLSFAIIFFSLSLSLYSQNTLWGTVQRGGQYNHGFLYKTDSIGNNLVVIHNFDSIHSGKSPGAIMQASNGKIYGMTSLGGHGVVQLPTGPAGYNTRGGTFFEYDPVLDSFRVLIHFNATDALYPADFQNPSELPVLEATPGKLWVILSMYQYSNSVGQARNRCVMSYDIATGVLSPVTIVASWTTPSLSGPQYSSINGPLYKGADGYVYGITNGYSSCAIPSGANNGSVIRIDPATNAFSYIAPFSCSYIDGWLPEANLVEVNGKYIGRTGWGGPTYSYPTVPGNGVIFEFDPVANTYTKKYDLQGGAMGRNVAGNTIKASNGKLYAAAYGGIINGNMPYGGGLIYEYDAVTNAYQVDHNFIDTNGSIDSVGTEGKLWVKGSNNKLYGTTALGIFEFNPSNNRTRPAARLLAIYNSYITALIALCKKPSYKYHSVINYNLCAGTLFHYDLHSYNTDIFVWKHNGITEASQTSGILHINQINVADAGTWVCEMTNACGVTNSQTITLTVNPAGSGIITSTITAAGSTTICPGSGITLSGNTNGGTWTNGSTAPSVTVGGPGIYQVSNTNACGLTFSNIITIDTIAMPLRSNVSFNSTGTVPLLTKAICQGDSVLAFGNVNGTWNTGETTPSIYIKDNLPHYVINSTVCHSVPSATLQAVIATPPIPPTIASAASVTICTGQSLVLDASGTTSYDWYNHNGISFSYAGNGNQITATQAGIYYIKIPTSCGPVYSQSVHVVVSGTALGPALITPLGSTVICQGSGVVLQSNHTSCVWNTGATTQTILATGAGPYTVTNYNSCSSATSAPMSISVTPAPVTNYTELQNSVCFTTGIFTLTAANPAGGYYSGTGVSGNTFDPVLAGVGTHTVTYNYQHPITGCTGVASQFIQVDGNPVLAAAPSTVICQGSNTVLYHDAPTAIWNTGASGLFLVVTQPGTFYVTKTNNCGAVVSSNTLQVVSIPSPTITITGNTAICAGSNTTLFGSGAATYSWTPAVTTQSIMVNPTATTVYTLTAQGSNACYAVTMTTVTVNPLPPVSVTNATICSGTSATLSVSGANTYTWSTTQTGTSIVVSPTVTTIFNVTGTSLNLCANTATTAVYVNSAIIPNITFTGTTLQSSPSVSYQWYLNGGIIAGATSQTYAPVQTGDYTVVVYDQNGCTATSAIYTLLDTGLSDLAGKTGYADVYPNPTEGNFIVNTPFLEFRIEVVNTLGQVVLKDNGSFISEFTIEKSGLYMIQIISDGHTYIKKMVVSGK